MKVELKKSLDLPVPSPFAWKMVEDIETMASCMPGAKITEKIDDTHYKGTITVRLGPATVSFAGEITVLKMDAATHTLQILGKGQDSGGSSGASLELTGQLVDTGPSSCRLSGQSAVTVTGKVAAFGSRLMGSVSEVLLKQFFDLLIARVEAAYAAGPDMAPDGQAAVAPAENSFNLLAFIWSLIKTTFGSLFGRSRTT